MKIQARTIISANCKTKLPSTTQRQQRRTRRQHNGLGRQPQTGNVGEEILSVIARRTSSRLERRVNTNAPRKGNAKESGNDTRVQHVRSATVPTVPAPARDCKTSLLLGQTMSAPCPRSNQKVCCFKVLLRDGEGQAPPGGGNLIPQSGIRPFPETPNRGFSESHSGFTHVCSAEYTVG